jgi:hypothetical protein
LGTTFLEKVSRTRRPVKPIAPSLKAEGTFI